jgi:hypothetical protein
LDAVLGHGPEWAAAYSALIAQYLGYAVRLLWEVEFDWWTEKAGVKIAADPGWISGLLDESS